MRRKRISLILILGTMLIMLGLPGMANSQGPTPTLPHGIQSATTITVPNIPVAVATLPTGRIAGVAGLEDRLTQVASAHRAGDAAKLMTFAGERFIDINNNRAQVILEMDASPNARALGDVRSETISLTNGKTTRVQHAPAISIRADLQASIAATGATFETAYQNSVQVSAPFASLEALAKLPGVRHVRLSYPAQQHDLPPDMPSAIGVQTSEGVNLTNANTWQGAGYNGSGVSLAVYDFGFTGWATRQANGDLPSGGQLVLRDFSAAYSFAPDTAGNQHGTACAEIAYDMAPGATIYLYAFSTDVEFGNAVNDFITNVSGLRVASMSIGWVNAGPYDGTGSINTIINNAQAAGIFWANSAGNSQRRHWSGTATQFTGDTITFGTGNIEGMGPSSGSFWNIASGTQLRIFLEWNDWNAGRTGNQNRIDYDMYLYRWTGMAWIQVASAAGNQCTTAVAPTEAINYTVPAGGPYNYGIVIQRYTGGGACPNNFGHWMQLFTFNGFFQAGEANAFWYVNQCNSLTIPADGDSAITVGATFWNEDTTSPLYGLEGFTSLGPRNAAGGGNPGTTVNKPDVTAPDGVSSVTYGASNGINYAGGGSGFWGTSGAAPHVAGLAVVSWSGRPDYSLAQQVTYVRNQAIYKADGGTCGGAGNPNNRYGYGRSNLGTVPIPGLWDGGGVDNNWTTAANWDDGRVPAITTPILFNATSTKNALANGTITADSINMATGYTGMVTLGGNLTVSNNLTITNGTLDASPSNFAIALGGNWLNNGGVFNPRAGGVTFNGTGVQTITGGPTFNNLAINNSVGVTLTNTTSVNGALALSAGDLNAGSGTNQLTLGCNATVSSAGGGDVVGDAVRTCAFTIGTPYAFNNPNTTLNFSGGSPPTSVTINLLRTKPSQLTTAVPRTYTITPSGGSGYTATLQLRYANTELTGMTESNLRLWRYNGSRYVLQGGTVSTEATNPYVSASDVAQFSPWAISDSGVPTVVTLSSFTASVEMLGQFFWVLGGGVGGLLLGWKWFQQRKNG